MLAARRRARPPGPQRVTCPLPQLRVGSRRVNQATDLARGKGAALLTVTVDSLERDAARSAVGTLVRAVLEHRPWAEVAWLPTLDDATAWAVRSLRPGDLCLIVGAGDVAGLGPRLVAALRERAGR